MGCGLRRLALRAQPKIPSATISPDSLGTMHCIGYVHEPVAMFGNKWLDRTYDPVVRDVMRKHKIFDKFNPEKYSRIRETHWGANKGVLKYDGPCGLPDADIHLLLQARQIMMRKYQPYAGTCEVISCERALALMKKDTHPGHEFRVRGFKDKGSVLAHPVTRQEVVDSWSDLDHPSIFKCSFKGGEMLKTEKVVENNGRVFIVADMKLIYNQTRLMYSIHEFLVRMSQDLRFPMKMGYPFQYGGFSRLMQTLYGYRRVVEGDVSKWDCSMLEWIAFEVILPLYILLFKVNKYCTKEEFEFRMYYIMRDLVHSIIVMPSGQVLVKHRGNPSGHLGTGDFNNIWHDFNIVLIYVVADKNQDLRRDTWYLLGDDHIFGTDSDEIADFDSRKRVYEMLGSTLNKEKDVISDSPVGHTFLGFTGEYDLRYNRIVPVYNLDKALCSALMPGGSVSPSLRYARLTGLRILTFFNPGYDLIKEIARECWSADLAFEPTDVDSEVMRLLLTWPSDEALERLWMGFEGSGGVGGLKSIEIGCLVKEIVHFINS